MNKNSLDLQPQQQEPQQEPQQQQEQQPHEETQLEKEFNILNYKK